MKFTLSTMLLFVALSVQAAGFPLRLKNVAVKKAMEELRQETGYSFIFAASEMNVNKKVSIDATSLKEAVEQILNGQNVTYEFKGKNIIVTRKIANRSVQNRSNVQSHVRHVTGTVTDRNGDPVVGATIKEKGKNNGTVTGIDGDFSLDVSDDAVLEVSYIGFVSQSLPAKGKMKILMSEDTESLNEVVVVGYGTMKKKDLTGAIGTIGEQAIAERHSTNLSTALQGAVAGLSVTRDGNAPGSTGTLRLRGVTTISTSDPLVIIDGVPGDMSMVNPDDVEQISVLKDAASAAIYGSRAAAGVILIQTKRAKKGDFRISYNFEYASQRPTATPEFVDAVQFMKMANEVRYNDNQSGGRNQSYSQDVIDNYASLRAQNPDEYGDTNWYDEIFNSSAPRQTHSVNLLAGSDRISTKVSLRYDKEEGLYGNLNNENYAARVNNDFHFSKFIDAHVDINFKKSKSSNPNFSPYGYNLSAALPPVYPARWSDGRLADVKDGNNPLAWLSYDAGRNRSDNNHIGFKGEIDIMPVEGLKISIIAAPNFEWNHRKTFNKKIGYTHLESPNIIAGYYNATTSLTEYRNKNNDFTTQILANYTKSFGKHDVNLLAGYENYHYKYDNTSGSGDHFELTSFPYLDLAPSDYQSVTGNAQEYAYRSFFGRVNYAYANKYLIEANIRRDGSSRFSKDNRWATFPSVSVGWVISEEKFMKETHSWLDQLKLRASWGKLGNERIGSYYPYQASIDFSQIALINGGQTTSATSASQTTYAVRDITWETTSSWDAGVDIVVLNSRLNFTFDIYRKKTSDMLLPVQIPMFLGYNNPDVNAGDMHTNGWDMEMGWRDQIGDFQYSAKLNLSNAVSKMGNLNGTVTYTDDGNRITR